MEPAQPQSSYLSRHQNTIRHFLEIIPDSIESRPTPISDLHNVLQNLSKQHPGNHELQNAISAITIADIENLFVDPDEPSNNFRHIIKQIAELPAPRSVQFITEIGCDHTALIMLRAFITYIKFFD